MTESVASVREIFFGLEEYLEFTNSHEQVAFLRDFVRILDSDDRETAILEYCVKHLIDQQTDTKDKFLRSVVDYNKKVNNTAIYDLMSRSQMRSKIWLIDQLSQLGLQYQNVAVLAGWFGQIKTIYDKKLTYRKMRIVELDSTACENSDYIFNLAELQDHKVKAVCANINQLTLHKNGYEWLVENFKESTSYTEKFLPDLIINTSAEHMTEEWFHQLRFKQLDSDPVVAIQSNNLFDIPEHVNCVHSVDHMQKKFPMRQVLFAGELQLKGYKRVMLIGRP